MIQRIQLVQQFAPVLLSLVRNAGRHDAFHGERRLRRIATGDKRLIALAQKSVW
jgi:hypothetical protein